MERFRSSSHGLADVVLFCWLDQVQTQLEQTLEKLQGEQALNQQLSAEVEQVQQRPRPCFFLIFKSLLFIKLIIPSFLGSGGPQKTDSEPSRTDEVS